MQIPNTIWSAQELNTYDKLILAVIGEDGSKSPEDIAAELQITRKRVSQTINRLTKDGWLAIIKTKGTTRMEVLME